LSRIGRNW